MTENQAYMQPLSTAKDVAHALNISIRQFHRLQKRWELDRRLKDGKHVIRIGIRRKRYNLSAMMELASRYGY